MVDGFLILITKTAAQRVWESSPSKAICGPAAAYHVQPNEEPALAGAQDFQSRFAAANLTAPSNIASYADLAVYCPVVGKFQK